MTARVSEEDLNETFGTAIAVLECEGFEPDAEMLRRAVAELRAHRAAELSAEDREALRCMRRVMRNVVSRMCASGGSDELHALTLIERLLATEAGK